MHSALLTARIKNNKSDGGRPSYTKDGFWFRDTATVQPFSLKLSVTVVTGGAARGVHTCISHNTTREGYLSGCTMGLATKGLRHRIVSLSGVEWHEFRTTPCSENFCCIHNNMSTVSVLQEAHESSTTPFQVKRGKHVRFGTSIPGSRCSELIFSNQNPWDPLGPLPRLRGYRLHAEVLWAPRQNIACNYVSLWVCVARLRRLSSARAGASFAMRFSRYPSLIFSFCRCCCSCTSLFF